MDRPAEAAVPAKRSRARRILRVVAWSFGGLVAILVVAIAIGWWVLGRETTLQRIVVEAERALGGQLKVEGVRGSIYDRISFDRLVFRSKTQVITVEKGSLRYHLAPILRSLSIADARAAHVTVETIAKSDEPIVEPDTLELPPASRLDTLRLDAVHVDTFDFVDGERRTTLTAADLRARYATEGTSRRWTVERIAVATPWGRAEGEGRIDATKPFALVARLGLEGRVDDVPYRAPLVVDGRLGEMTLTSDFSVSDPTNAPLAGHADARVMPFQPQPLAAATLHVAGLAPQRWRNDLPEADLSIDATIAPRPAVASPGTNPFAGTLHAVNAQPGPIDRNRIPVASIDATVEGDSLAVAVSALRADLGAAGRLTGRGRYDFAGGEASLESTVTALDLRAIHGKLIASRFAGPLNVSRSAGVTRLATELSDTGRHARLRGESAGNEIRLTEADVQVWGSRIAAAGRIDLGKDRPFDVAGTASHVDPHDLGDFARADVNGAFRLAGSLGTAVADRPQRLDVRSDVRIDPSRVFGRPLAGTIAGRVEAVVDGRRGAPPIALQSIDGAHVALVVGANRVTADGDFGRPADRLRWTVDAPKLADFEVGLTGRFTGSGSVGGTLAEPSLEFTVAGDDLRYAQASRSATNMPANGKPVSAAKTASAASVYGVGSIRGNGRLQAGANGRVDVDVAVNEVRDGSAKTPIVRSATAHVDGTRGAHRATLAAVSDRFDFSVAASGGLDRGNVWRGLVDSLANRGRVPFALAAPTTLVAGVDRVELGAARVRFDEGAIDLDRLVYANQRLDTAGRASGFPLSVVGTFSRDFAQRVSTSLRFGATWDLRAGDTVDGSLRVYRESGNVRFLADPRIEVDPEHLEVVATIASDRVSVHALADGAGLGLVDATLDTRLTRRDGRWGLAGDAPLALKGDVDLPDLRWLARLSGVPGLDVSGAAKVAVTGRGTVAHPSLSGHASADALAVKWPAQGLNARDGRIDLDFDGDRVLLKQATLVAGDGHLDASGDLRLADGRALGALDLKFERFQAVARSDRTMVVSGSGALKFGPTGIDVTADVKADRGSLQLAQRSGPAMSTDIVIVGRENDEAAPPPSATPVRFEVRFDMGDDFKVKGSGFDGKLGGNIRISGPATDLRAIGTVSVREGTYEGYGQKLQIDRGNLVFSGPIDNPALDIYAVRKNLAVEAGVQITGTALAPEARLVSTPDVPDTEKLSWLMLGHGLAASTKSDYGTLASAAAGLLGSSDSTSIQSRIAATLGVDEIGVTAGSNNTGLLTIGKQISTRLRVSIEQGITHAATLVKLRYNIYKQIDLQVAAGTESSIDIFYTFSFD